MGLGGDEEAVVRQLDKLHQASAIYAAVIPRKDQPLLFEQLDEAGRDLVAMAVPL